MLEMKPLNLHVILDGKPDPHIHVNVYTFSRDGKYLGMTPLDKEGRAKLEFSFDQASGIQLFIGPALHEGEVPTLRLMERMHAYQPAMQAAAIKRDLAQMYIPEAIWQRWCPAVAHVTGQVVRQIHAGPFVFHKPVCQALVHICEVDPLFRIIPKLPESVIWKLRDELLHLIDIRWPRPPIPDPEPDPWWEMDPELPQVNPAALRDFAAMPLAPVKALQTPKAAQLPMAMQRFELPAAEMAVRPMKALPTGMKKELSVAQPLAPLAPQLQPALLSKSVQAVRQALIDHAAQIRPYICYFPWFWPFYRYDEVATVLTDHDGRFSADVFYWACLDKPDLYFWTEYCIGGTWTTVQRRPVSCATYWNYQSGTMVAIELNNPLVPWCEQPPEVSGQRVVVMTVGDGINVAQLRHDGEPAAQEGLTLGGAPLGGSLEPHVYFGTGLRDAGYQYRWAYRPLGGTPDDWHVMDYPVLRHYAVIQPDHRVTFEVDKMGPFGADQLFKIQPAMAPGNNTWVPAVNSRLNTASGYFRTDWLSMQTPLAGKFELKLELFDAAGHLVDPVAQGITFEVPKADLNAPFTGAVDTVDVPAYYKLDETDSHGVVHRGFRMVVHVDNNPCYAEINPTQVITGAAVDTAGPCGFIEYQPGASAVKLSFVASHPHDFAYFDFILARGSSGSIQTLNDVPVNATTVAAFGVANGVVRTPGTHLFTAEPMASTILGPCTQGAFAETLYVAAMATDGFGRLSYLDYGAVPKAFALTPTTI